MDHEVVGQRMEDGKGRGGLLKDKLNWIYTKKSVIKLEFCTLRVDDGVNIDYRE